MRSFVVTDWPKTNRNWRLVATPACQRDRGVPSSGVTQNYPPQGKALATLAGIQTCSGFGHIAFERDATSRLIFGRAAIPILTAESVTWQTLHVARGDATCDLLS